MMHSDLYALTACAISVLYIPFFMIAQLRYTHVLQRHGYSNVRFLKWLRCNLWMTLFPMVGICALVLMGRLLMDAYLSYTALYDVGYFIGFFVVLLLIATAVTVVFTQYIQSIKMESKDLPFVITRHVVAVYAVTGVLIGVLTLVINVVHHAKVLVFFTPLLVPFLVPFANYLIVRAGSHTPIEQTSTK